jgi:hypothetical protein
VSLDPREHIVLKRWANMSQGYLARAGRLVLTDRRVVFRPHTLERLTGETTLAVPRDGVVTVGLAPRTPRPFGGGMLRKRLRLMLRDRATAHVVVNQAAEVAELFRCELGVPASAAENAS